MKTLIASPENVKALIMKAYCYLKIKNNSAAVTALNDAIHYYPSIYNSFS